jgi:hypothetical protein
MATGSGATGIIAGNVQVAPPSVVREKVSSTTCRVHARYAVAGRCGSAVRFAPSTEGWF